MIPYIKTNHSLTAIIGGKSYLITDDNPSYNQVWDAICYDEPAHRVRELFVIATAIKRYLHGNIEVKGDQLYYKGEIVHNVVAERIIEFMSTNQPYEPLVKFLDRLLANPSRRSIEELYTFMAHKGLPITDDGYFLAYKGVTNEYLDCHSRKFDNHPGVVNKMPRSTVDDDFRRGCSYGFHVGSLEYATGFGSRTVIVKVDPADVVSVPSDCEFQKLRTCKYEVICDYEGVLPNALHRSDSNPYTSSNRWDDDVDRYPTDY